LLVFIEDWNEYIIFNIFNYKNSAPEFSFLDNVIILSMFMSSFIFCDSEWSFRVEGNMWRFMYCLYFSGLSIFALPLTETNI
jgi:hypothetical protein